MSSSLEHVESPPGLTLRPFYELTKPGITVFVTILTGVSFFVAASATFGVDRLLHTVFGTGLATAGALAFNQYIERDKDALMVRTRNRPVPSGRVAPKHAATFGLVLMLAGAGHLLFWVGWPPAALTALSSLLYVAVYTPLKTRTYVATLVGAFPGAMPVLIGWSAATGRLSLGGLAVFGIFFLWQLPHVLALAWMCREDYARVGFLMAPPGDAEGRMLSLHMVLSATALIPVSLAPTLLGMTGGIYMTGALLAGVLLLVATLTTVRAMTEPRARRVFLGTLLYQPFVLALLLIDTIRA